MAERANLSTEVLTVGGAGGRDLALGLVATPSQGTGATRTLERVTARGQAERWVEGFGRAWKLRPLDGL